VACNTPRDDDDDDDDDDDESASSCRCRGSSGYADVDVNVDMDVDMAPTSSRSCHFRNHMAAPPLPPLLIVLTNRRIIVCWVCGLPSFACFLYFLSWQTN
jgi:hypothetical protein